MEKISEKIETENEIAKKLIELIEQDKHTMLLTAAQFALRDLADGQINSALLRLKIDLDKLIINKELYNFVQKLLEDRNLTGEKFKPMI